MREAFAKASNIFSTKNICIFEKLTSENLTKRQLTTSLVLNNWAQKFFLLTYQTAYVFIVTFITLIFSLTFFSLLTGG